MSTDHLAFYDYLYLFILDDKNTPVKVNLPTNNETEDTTDLQTDSDTSNSKAVNVTKDKTTTEKSRTTEQSESTMDLTRKPTTQMMLTNLTKLTTKPMTTQRTTIMMETSTEPETTTTTQKMRTTTTEMTTEEFVTEMTTRFTPAIRRTTTPATSNFLSKIPLLGVFAKGLGIKIKGCRCRLYICSCCTTAKLDVIGGDGKELCNFFLTVETFNYFFFSLYEYLL